MAGSFDQSLDSISVSISKGSVYESGGLSMFDAALEDALGREEKPISNESIQKGDTLLDTYTVEADAISGGMGSVWRVHHQSWNTDLAMKRPQPRFFAEGSRKRKENFIKECEAWINLGLHPNIVSCYYVREIGGVPTIFSEWMNNGSLKDRIRDGSLYIGTEVEQEERLLDLAIQFARGLRYSHENGLIHRDVKPDNLLLTKDWDAKVADFGLAKARDEAISEDGTAHKGGYTPEYCSGEQAAELYTDARTDVYSWALTVLEMYTKGRVWESGPTVSKNREQFINAVKLPLPEGLRGLLYRCFEADADKRPGDFAEIEATLREIYKSETDGEYPRPEPKAAADTADSMNNRALSFLDLGKPKEAERMLEIATTLDESCVEAVFNQSVLKWENGAIDDIAVQNRLLAVISHDDLLKRKAKADLLNQLTQIGVVPRLDEKTEKKAAPNIRVAKVFPVWDFQIIDAARIALLCTEGVRSDDDSWIQAAINPGQQKPRPRKWKLWDVSNDREVPDSFTLTDQRQAVPENVIQKAMESGWLTDAPICSALSPDGSRALLASTGRVALTDTQTGHCLRTATYEANWPPHRVAFSSDGTRCYVCYAEDGVPATFGLFCWQLPNETVYPSRVICRIVTTSQNKQAERVFEDLRRAFNDAMRERKFAQAAESLEKAEAITGFNGGERLKQMRACFVKRAVPTGVSKLEHLVRVERVSGEGKLFLSPNGEYAVFPNGRLMNLRENRQIFEEKSFTMCGGFSADSKKCLLVSGSHEGCHEMLLWDVDSEKCVKQYTFDHFGGEKQYAPIVKLPLDKMFRDSTVKLVAIDPAGEYFAAFGPGSTGTDFRLFNLAGEDVPMNCLKLQKAPVVAPDCKSICFDDEYFAAKDATVIELRSGKICGAWDERKDGPACMMCGGRYVAAGYDDYSRDGCAISIWERESGKTIFSSLVMRNPVQSDFTAKDISVSSDGRFVLYAYDNMGKSEAILMKLTLTYSDEE